MASTKEVMKLIGGTGHFNQSGLADYHAAKAVVNANRRVGQDRRASGMRQALKAYSILLSYTPSANGPIRLYSPAKREELIIEATTAKGA